MMTVEQPAKLAPEDRVFMLEVGYAAVCVVMWKNCIESKLFG